MSADGTWEITIQTPMGAQTSTVELTTDGGALTGSQSGNGETGAIYDGSVDGDTVTWKADVTKPFALSITFSGTIDGDAISGKAQAGAFPPMPFTGSRS
jgi:hypothetical protein